MPKMVLKFSLISLGGISYVTVQIVVVLEVSLSFDKAL